MILAAPLVIPFAKAVGLSVGALGMAALADQVNEYIQANPEESMKILSTIVPNIGIGQIFMNKEKISLEDLDEMTDEEAQDLSKEEKAELMKQAGKSGGPNKRQTMIDISEKLGLSGEGKEKQDIEYDIDERYDEGGVEEVSKPKFDYKKFFRNRRADGGAIGIEVLFEEKKDGGRAGSTMKSKRGLVDEPGGYAGLTEQQEALLGLQLQNDPEYQTGFYKSSPELKFEDFYKAPVGPLRYVDEVQGSDSYFDEDLEKYNIGPAGPLRNLDPARTQGILETLDFKDPSGELALNYIDRLKPTEDGGFYETVQTNKPKFSEFQLIPKDQIKIAPPKNFQNLSSTPKKGVYGYTTLGMPPSEYGTTFMNQTNPVYLSENLAKYITTKPMSPANQKLIFDTGVTGMYAAKPADLMSKAIDTIQHEYAHNITKFPAFANVMKNAMNAPTPKDFQLKGKPGDDLSKYDKEELFTRALDIERLLRKEGDLNNPSIDLDLDYMNSILSKKYRNLNDQGQSLAIQYINSLRPQVKDYFDTVDRLNVLGRDKDRGGFDPSGPTQASIRATREDRSGRGQRGGFTNPGKGSYGPFMADGGRVGFNLGGLLTGQAKSIYDFMNAAGYFTEDEIRNAIIGAGYEIPGASQPETTAPAPNTGIIGAQLNNDIGPAAPIGAPSSLVTGFKTATQERQNRLTNPNKASALFNKFTGGGQRDIGEMIRSGQVDQRKLAGIPTVGNIIGKALPDKYFDMSLGDQVFTQAMSGYTGPTVFGENTTGLSKDPFGLNVRSGFGNYAEAVGKDFASLRESLTGRLAEKYGVEFDEETGMFKGKNAALANKMTNMMRTKFNFRKDQLAAKNRLDAQIKAAEKQRQEAKRIQDELAAAAAAKDKAAALAAIQKQGRQDYNPNIHGRTDYGRDSQGNQSFDFGGGFGIGSDGGPVSNRTGRGRTGYSEGGLASMFVEKR